MSEQNYEVSDYLGIAPFLRCSINGENLMPLAKALFVETAENIDNANAWLNLSIVLECIGLPKEAHNAQLQALNISREYLRNAARQPVSLRLLMFVIPGNLATNTPLDCLLEFDDVEIVYYYINDDFDNINSEDFQFFLTDEIPEHDVAMCGFADQSYRGENAALWQQKFAEYLENNWEDEQGTPLINSPKAIGKTRRDVASKEIAQLADMNLVMAEVFSIPAEDLANAKLPENLKFPFIIRPAGSQAGRGLEKIDNLDELKIYYQNQQQQEPQSNLYFASEFVDYKSAKDNLYRKMRIAVVEGEPYICHLAISENWKVHYVNANMYDENQQNRRDEENQFMNQGFSEVAEKFADAFMALYEKTGLDYFCMDCALLDDGRLVIFEFDQICVVHDMDRRDKFAYKAQPMARLRDAFRDYLLRV